MAKQLKRWQGWLLFGGSMVVVFILGLLVSSLLERRAEVVSIFNNRKTPMEGIVKLEVRKRLPTRIRNVETNGRHNFQKRI